MAQRKLAHAANLSQNLIKARPCGFTVASHARGFAAETSTLPAPVKTTKSKRQPSECEEPEHRDEQEGDIGGRK